MNRPARRVRVTRSAVTTLPKADAVRMDELLTALCAADKKMKSIANSRAQDAEELLKLMQFYKKTELRNSAGEADVVIPPGRKSTWIDPKKFYKKVTEDEFFESITVGVTLAKKVLSEKEIAAIAKVTPAKPGDPTLVVKPV